MSTHRFSFSHPLRMRAFQIQKWAHSLRADVYIIAVSHTYTLRRRRPHEPSSRPPCRPFPDAVEPGGHGGGKSKRKGSRLLMWIGLCLVYDIPERLVLRYDVSSALQRLIIIFLRHPALVWHVLKSLRGTGRYNAN